MDASTSSSRPSGGSPHSRHSLEFPLAELEIRDPAGKLSRFPLRGERFLIGRLPEVQIRLDHQTVSRRHAELVRDPFGRWWIRDLGSSFGTLVGGARVAEQVLDGDEDIRIGAYRLRLLSMDRTVLIGAPDAASSVVLRDEAVGALQTLREAEAPKITASHLAAVMQLGAEIAACPDEAARMRLLCERFVDQTFHGRVALLLRVQPHLPDVLPTELMRAAPADGQAGGATYVSRTLLRSVCQSREPVLASNTPLDAVHARLSLSPTQLRMAAVACPLRENRDGLEVLYVALPPECGTAEWLALASLAAAQYRQAEFIWRFSQRTQMHQSIERDLERARDIQGRLVPRDVTAAHVDLAIGFHPCWWVGGDYVDAVPIGADRLLVLVGDVSGKGLPAALLTGNLHAIVHASVGGEFDLGRMLATVNRYLQSYLPEDCFVTMLCLLLNTETGEFRFVNAGHPPPIVIEPDGRLREVASARNLPLGVMEIDPTTAPEMLRNDQWLIIYTDGVTDLVNEQNARLGFDGLFELLQRVFAAGAAMTAQEALDATYRALDEYQGRAMPADDRTLLILRRN
ncbi:MAG: SpoIIE family protein phosphatase [Phycisphaerae bacterium]